jgi:hypothetical protein
VDYINDRNQARLLFPMCRFGHSRSLTPLRIRFSTRRSPEPSTSAPHLQPQPPKRSPLSAGQSRPSVRGHGHRSRYRQVHDRDQAEPGEGHGSSRGLVWASHYSAGASTGCAAHSKQLVCLCMCTAAALFSLSACMPVCLSACMPVCLSANSARTELILAGRFAVGSIRFKLPFKSPYGAAIMAVPQALTVDAAISCREQTGLRLVRSQPGRPGPPVHIRVDRRRLVRRY